MQDERGRQRSVIGVMKLGNRGLRDHHSAESLCLYSPQGASPRQDTHPMSGDQAEARRGRAPEPAALLRYFSWHSRSKRLWHCVDPRAAPEIGGKGSSCGQCKQPCTRGQKEWAWGEGVRSANAVPRWLPRLCVSTSCVPFLDEMDEDRAEGFCRNFSILIGRVHDTLGEKQERIRRGQPPTLPMESITFFVLWQSSHWARSVVCTLFAAKTGSQSCA